MKTQPKISIGRINRRLASRRERIERTAAQNRPSLGEFVLMDARRNAIVAVNVDPQRLAKKLGIDN